MDFAFISGVFSIIFMRFAWVSMHFKKGSAWKSFRFCMGYHASQEGFCMTFMRVCMDVHAFQDVLSMD